MFLSLNFNAVTLSDDTRLLQRQRARGETFVRGGKLFESRKEFSLFFWGSLIQFNLFGSGRKIDGEIAIKRLIEIRWVERKRVITARRGYAIS